MSALHGLTAVLRLTRPHQWLKNVFVFAGLVFSQSWAQADMVQRVLFAFLAFCCVSSFGGALMPCSAQKWKSGVAAPLST